MGSSAPSQGAVGAVAIEKELSTLDSLNAAISETLQFNTLTHSQVSGDSSTASASVSYLSTSLQDFYTPKHRTLLQAHTSCDYWNSSHFVDLRWALTPRQSDADRVLGHSCLIEFRRDPNNSFSGTPIRLSIFQTSTATSPT